MNETWLDSLQTALGKAKEERDRACYLEECGGNSGIRKMNANKAAWLSHIIYLAELGLECEKRIADVASTEAKMVNDESKSDFQKAIELFRRINN